MDSKTYVFGNDSGSSGQGGMMSLLAPLLQQRGLDPNLLLAMNKGNGGFGEGSWFMWVIFLFFLMGWGGNGWGGFGNNGRGGYVANEINNDYGRSLLMDAIGGNRNAISNLATQLNCTEGQIQGAINALSTQMSNVGNQVGMSGQQIVNAIQQGNMTIAQQLAECCCRTNNAITAMDGNIKLAMCQQTGTLNNAINNVLNEQEKGFASSAYETQRQTCELQDTIKASTQQILDGQRAAEMRELQNKIDNLHEENSTFKSSAMTNQIVGQAVAPINAFLANLQKDVDGIKCKLPETATVPYQPFQAIPNCVAAQYGLYGYNAAANGFWG